MLLGGGGGGGGSGDCRPAEVDDKKESPPTGPNRGVDGDVSGGRLRLRDEFVKTYDAAATSDSRIHESSEAVLSSAIQKEKNFSLFF